MFNDENECGTGAVVPWAGRLWVVTYAPHKPEGSTDKLYEITSDLQQVIRPESIGGTPANRMVHRESRQLFIGPYVIDARGGVRTIPYSRMFGRPTGMARHLTVPARKVYCATMEEGLYEIDVDSLDVTELWADEQRREGRHASLPGYHGKGLYSGQGRLIYSNNGDHAKEALSNPAVPSGVLASWDGFSASWEIIRRNQFTEVSGPGGIHGNRRAERDPVWSIGWDHRSLILMVLDGGSWRAYRLPKASHAYDGAHGWNTEWPRIREIGGGSMLMTMHGMFWDFPRHFDSTHSHGISPRSTYLKVIGDFCEWNRRVVFGCDDSARSEFLNKRPAKGALAGPGRSQSNLWFVSPAQLDDLGPALGRGAVWLRDRVEAGAVSEPYLFSGFTHRSMHIVHGEDSSRTFTLEVDRRGSGVWRVLRELTVPGHGREWVEFPASEEGAWIRVRARQACDSVTAFFHHRSIDRRSTGEEPLFDALARAGDSAVSGGLLLAQGGSSPVLRVLGQDARGERGCYDLDERLNLTRVSDPAAAEWMRRQAAIPSGILTVDNASVLYVGEGGRWRLPRRDAAIGNVSAPGETRICREVCTERDLFQADGSFYELPALNAGGFARIRPISSHGRWIQDFVSYRGMLALSGLRGDARAGGHVVRSEDGACALWLGVIDDLWKLGKPRGIGGPWNRSPAKSGVPSDPYLMTGYDRKRVELAHAEAGPVGFRIEADISGDGDWVTYRDFKVEAGETVAHVIPAAFGAYWVRAVADRDCTATVVFTYD